MDADAVRPPPRPALILVTINPAYRLSELEFALAKVGCAGDRHGHRVQDL